MNVTAEPNGQTNNPAKCQAKGLNGIEHWLKGSKEEAATNNTGTPGLQDFGTSGHQDRRQDAQTPAQALETGSKKCSKEISAR